jgi:hypothetical protein
MQKKFDYVIASAESAWQSPVLEKSQTKRRHLHLRARAGVASAKMHHLAMTT